MSTRDHARAPLLVLTATLGQSRWLEHTVRSVGHAAGLAAAHVLIAPARESAALRRRFPQCWIIDEPVDACGLYAALNQGLRATAQWDWRWMTFLADDDLLLPAFQQLYRAADARTHTGEAAVWHGEVAVIDADGRRLCRVPYARSSRDIAALVAAGYSPFNQQGMLYSRAAVERTGEFAASMRVCADAAHWLSALERGATFHRVPVSAAAFRVRAGQISGDVSTHRGEFGGLREQARRIHGAQPLWPAVLRFRMFNAALYLERVRNVGLTSGFGLLKTT